MGSDRWYFTQSSTACRAADRLGKEYDLFSRGEIFARAGEGDDIVDFAALGINAQSG